MSDLKDLKGKVLKPPSRRVVGSIPTKYFPVGNLDALPVSLCLLSWSVLQYKKMGIW